MHFKGSDDAPGRAYTYIKSLACLLTALFGSLMGNPIFAQDIEVTGELKRWHPVTITLDGPQASEDGAPNPFLDYRFDVVFSLQEISITVPGYFAADGNAAETGATSGNKWRAHFIPPMAGSWTFRTSFRQGNDVSLSTNPNAGTSVDAYDDIFSSLNIAETDKSGRDFRGKGVLRYVGEHYLQFDNGEYYIKGGTDSPENFLAYADFDATYNNGGTDFIKSYSSHIGDWQEGNPTWQNGKGKGIIGALNYLASEGMNSVYFITMNIAGDGQDVWPYTSPNERYRFDVSKLDQWNIVFNHMDQQGLLLHVLTQETENELLLDGGALGRERQAYFKELIARFSAHNALVWNLGEENDENTDAQRKAFADYIRALDPYDHPIVIHTFPSQWDNVYAPLLGYPNFEGPSLQVGKPEDTHQVTLEWVNRSAQAGRKWYVCMDEAGPWQDGAKPDGPGNNHDEVRREVLWGNYMAGGCGVEWYFGFNHPNNDFNAEDWRSRDAFWDYTRHALDFFHTYLPFVEMRSRDDLSSNGNSYVFAKEDEVYAVYLKFGGSTELNLSGTSKTYSVKWFNPRTGGALVDGSVTEVEGGSNTGIGMPPVDTSQDWVALLREKVDRLKGDLTGDGQVSAQDASLTLQHTIGLIVLPNNLLSVADVSGNGVVSAFDGSMILQRVVGLIDCFPSEPSCNANKTQEEPSAASPVITLHPVQVSERDYVVTLDIEGASSMHHAVELDIRYHPDQKQLQRFETRLPDAWTLVDHAMPGRLRLAAAGAAAPLTNGQITLYFTTEPGAGPASPVSASAIIDESPPVTTQTEGATASVPSSFSLSANYPNPFNPTTTIRYAIAEASQVHLDVFDLTGRVVAELVDKKQPAGHYSVQFDASNLPSGIYLYRLEAGGMTQMRKMTLIK